MEEKSSTGINPFTRVENLEDILPILEARLPKSAHMFNMALTEAQFREDMSFYILDLKTGESNFWIVAKYEREDNGTQISISIPNECTQVPPLVEAFFQKSGLIEWDKEHEFQAIERCVSRMIMNVSLDKGNAIAIYPCNYYYLEPKEAKELDKRFTELPPEVKLNSLNSELGIKFLAIGGPKPSSPEAGLTYIRKTVERNDYSLGIFVNEEPVSRICVATTGHMGFLMTLDNHRRKGYSAMLLERVIHKLATESNLHPCAMVDIQNRASNAVHSKVGLKLSHIADFIIYEKEFK